MPQGRSKFEIEVAERRMDRSGAVHLDLRPVSGGLPRFKAGSHIDLFLPNGLIRSYSLMNDEQDEHRYVCGIALDRSSRGGSSYVHAEVARGSRLMISEPKNLFPLAEQAEQSILFAGGIGVTPLISMARRLEALGKDWRLYHCARTREVAPFFEELKVFGDRVIGQFDDERPSGYFDLAARMKAAPDGAHFYCCGPSPMISAFEAAGRAFPADHVHLERFSASETPATGGGFTVELARSGVVLSIPEGKSILEALEEANIDVPFSCLAGICGSCVTGVLAGTPDHRDMVLTDEEKKRNDRMMICCSGSLSERLILDR